MGRKIYSMDSMIPEPSLGSLEMCVRATLIMKPQPKDTQGDKGQYENNDQLVQWISSVYKSANDRYIETCLVQ